MYKSFRGSMKKTLSLIPLLFILNGCAESLALLGPVTTGASGSKMAQSAVSSAVSFGVKHSTGMSPTEHAMSFINENNPELKKEKCVYFLEASNSETCAAIKNRLVKVKESILEKSKIENLEKTFTFKKR